MELSNLTVVFSSYTKSDFDFVGELINKDDKYLYLKNALIIDYDFEDETNSRIKGTLRLLPGYVPIDLYTSIEGTTLALPHEYVGYYLTFPGNKESSLRDLYINELTKATTPIE